MRFLTDAGFQDIRIEANGGFFKHYGQESQRFSVKIDPRRVSGIARFFTAPLWLVSVPFFRILLPLVCHYLDTLDSHRGFTVGYHITAVRRIMDEAYRLK